MRSKARVLAESSHARYHHRQIVHQAYSHIYMLKLCTRKVPIIIPLTNLDQQK